MYYLSPLFLQHPIKHTINFSSVKLKKKLFHLCYIFGGLVQKYFILNTFQCLYIVSWFETKTQVIIKFLSILQFENKKTNIVVPDKVAHLDLC